ncbi:hypothetical protein GBA52_023094 [Prunus armeniaca]|nr:hypothetical protein GBA52_023094 [Prunus armeniaca]
MAFEITVIRFITRIRFWLHFYLREVSETQTRCGKLRVQKLRSSRPVKPYHTSSLDDELDLYSRSCSTSVAFSDLQFSAPNSPVPHLFVLSFLIVVYNQFEQGNV